jgi:CubicO group peptidase (beta-lactamase class C family)
VKFQRSAGAPCRLYRLVIGVATATAALAMVACAARHATEAPTSSPISGRIAISPEFRTAIDTMVQATIAQQHLAGVSLAIAQNGSILYARGYGWRNVAKRLPARADTVYNIASISKQFTAASALLLQQDGRLSLDDPLSKYLPSLRHAHEVTLLEMLNHTSGLPDYLDLVDNNNLSYPVIISALKNAPLRFKPGTKFQYSNTNYVLMGPIVQQASGVPYDDFVTRRIIRPLHLSSTSVGTTPIDMPNGATGYTVIKGKLVSTPPQAAAVAILDFPDGAVNSTVTDLVAWDAALDNGQVVDEQNLRLMMTPGHYRAERRAWYGVGLEITQVNGHREVFHQGQWTGYAGENATFPDDGFDVVLLSNTDTFDEQNLVLRIFELFHTPLLLR